MDAGGRAWQGVVPTPFGASAPGFQTLLYPRVAVETGRATDLPMKLTIGAITQTIEVTGQAAMLEVTSNQVAATISNDYIEDLPLSGRDTLLFAQLTPGYAGGTFNGLFQSALNISLDGTNVNDTRMKSGSGFSSLVPLRLDAIEEVTGSTTGLEADAAAGNTTSFGQLSSTANSPRNVQIRAYLRWKTPEDNEEEICEPHESIFVWLVFYCGLIVKEYCPTGGDQ